MMRKKEIFQLGFTLMEVMVVVIVIAVMVAFALPKFSVSIEKSRALEGEHTLTALLGAQKRYFFENSSYTANITDLDVTIPHSDYFNPPSAVAGGGGIVAEVIRTNSYKFLINESGTITCQDNLAPAGTCKKLGY